MDGILKFNYLSHIFILSTKSHLILNINFNKNKKKARFMALKYYWPERYWQILFYHFFFN